MRLDSCAGKMSGGTSWASLCACALEQLAVAMTITKFYKQLGHNFLIHSGLNF